MSEPILHLKDASISQGDNLVLTNVNIEINKGEFVYLIGKTRITSYNVCYTKLLREAAHLLNLKHHRHKI